MAERLKGFIKKDVDRIGLATRAFEAGGPPLSLPQPDPREPELPIRCVLLTDLGSGLTVQAQVMRLQLDHDIQAVKLLGNVTGGTFTVSYKDSAGATAETTDPIAVTADGPTMRDALAALPSLSKKIVKVDKFPGWWNIQFIGKAPGSVEKLTVDNNLVLGSLRAVVVVDESWEDAGFEKKVRSIIPVGDPTPQVAGAVVACVWFGAAGYCVVSVEPRDFPGV